MATGNDVISRVREVINDNASAFISAVRWSNTELLRWITDAQREIVKTKPEAYPVTALFSVVGTQSRQRLDPEAAYRLLRVEANGSVIGEDDTPQYGAVVRIVERDVFDSFNPSWSVERELDSSPNYFRLYCMDAGDPLAFWLYPVPRSADSQQKVWVIYAGIPAALEDAEDDLSLSDMYIAPVVDYTVYRALAKESREANREVAERFLRSFYAALGVHRPILMQIGQNATRPPDAAA